MLIESKAQQEKRNEVMARRAIPLSEQIDRQEAIVIAMKKKYDASVEKLEKLVTKQRELESKEILEHLKTTSRSFNEIIAFLDGNDLDENKDYLEAFTDAKPGDTIILLDNIALAEPARLDKVGTFTIDGNGKTISAADGASFGDDGCLCFGPGGQWTADQVSTKIFTIKNL